MNVSIATYSEIEYTYSYLKFVYPCIVNIIVNDYQQDTTILAYLFIPN